MSYTVADALVLQCNTYTPLLITSSAVARMQGAGTQWAPLAISSVSGISQPARVHS